MSNTKYRGNAAEMLPEGRAAALRPAPAATARPTRAEAIGYWLRHGLGAVRNALSPYLSTEGFTFTVTEFHHLRQEIQEAARRQSGFHTAGALDGLNTGLFRHQELSESREFVSTRLADFLQRAEDLHQHYLLVINGHARRELRRHITRLPASPAALRDLHAETVRLSPQTVGGPTAQTLTELSAALATLIRDIDESGLYQLPSGGKEAATAPRQLRILEQVRDRLRATTAALPRFDEFYHRRRYWYTRPAHLRRLLTPLADLPPEQWVPAFHCWYWEQAILQSSAPEPPERLPAQLAVEPFAEFTARSLIVSGVRDSRLVFQQPFVVIRPPDWAGSQGKGETGTTIARQELPGRTKLLLPSAADYDTATRFAEGWPHLVTTTDHLEIVHDWTEDDITRSLFLDGIHPRFLAAVLIRAATYAGEADFDADGFAALGAEVRRRYRVVEERVHPLVQALSLPLRPRLKDHFLEVHHPWRDGFLPLLLTGPDGKKTVLLPDGKLSPQAPEENERFRQEELREAGFRLISIDAERLWREGEAAIEALVVAVKK